VHDAIDDATRLAYVEVLTEEEALTAIGYHPFCQPIRHWQNVFP